MAGLREEVAPRSIGGDHKDEIRRARSSITTVAAVNSVKSRSSRGFPIVVALRALDFLRRLKRSQDRRHGVLHQRGGVSASAYLPLERYDVLHRCVSSTDNHLPPEGMPDGRRIGVAER